MVDDWQSAKKSGSDSLHPWQQEAIRGTDFVASRRRILDCGCEKALQEIDDGTLDFVFLSNQHSTGVERLDLEKWATKIKVGGFLAGRFGKGVIDRSKAMSPVQQFASKHSFKIVTDKDNSWFIEIQRRHPTVRSGALFTFTNKKRTQ
ncbi:MAG: hypothetical protein JNG86_04745 [Verrucomicrobiaceae bacterium]|nr:hypothetical protein [Verrucomicrobiaceae bacterium]